MNPKNVQWLMIGWPHDGGLPVVIADNSVPARQQMEAISKLRSKKSDPKYCYVARVRFYPLEADGVLLAKEEPLKEEPPKAFRRR